MNYPVVAKMAPQSEPVVVEQDEQERLSNALPSNVVKPKVVRPVALKVVRPIPQKVAEEFYRQAHENGINAHEVHAAVIESHDWHRKWHPHNEEGHDVVEEPERTSSYSAVIPEHYTYDPMDRMMGAKNPSPEDKDSSYERKRVRLEVKESSPSGDSQKSDSLGHIVKRRTATQLSEAVVPSGPPQEAPAHQHLIRPVALRIAKPQAVLPPVPFTGHDVPRHVLRSMRSSSSMSQSSTATSLSTLTGGSGGSYHRQTNEPRSQANIVEDDGVDVPSVITHPSRGPRINTAVQNARDGILHALATSGGEVSSEEFKTCLDYLTEHFAASHYDTRPADSERAVEGMWLTLTKPNFFGNLGDNDNGDPMYTLGRMSFDMFSPTNLVCSLQGNFNEVERVVDKARPAMIDLVPKGLRDEVAGCESVLRTYNVVTAFTIEPFLPAFPDGSPNKDVRRPIRGIMTTYGYTLPDPEEPNRHSVWITGGKIEPNDDPLDQKVWNEQFARHPPKHGIGQSAKLLAVKLLMGATMATEMAEDGSMEYTFTRPLGGHGMAYVDVLYVDESLRIVRGHRGTIFVFSRLHEKTQQPSD